MVGNFFKFRFFLLLLSFPLQSIGQYQAGIQYSNYTDVISAVGNPALITTSKIRIGVNIINAEATVFNNYTRWNAPFSFLSFFTGSVPGKYINPSGLIVWEGGYAKTNQSKGIINGNASIRVLGPSFLFNFKQSGIGFQVGVNLVGFGSFTNTSEEIGRHIVEIRPAGLFDTKMIDNRSKISIGYYKEFYLSLSKQLINNRYHKFSAGLTLKYLTSNNYLGLDGQSLDYTVSRSPAAPNKSRTAFQKTQGTFYFAEGNTGINVNSILQEIGSLKSLGTGFSGNVGITYEYRPNQLRYAEKKNGVWNEKVGEVGYTFKVGFSLEDIGYVRYGNVKVGDVDNSNTVIFDNNDFRDNSSPSRLINLIETKYNLNPASYRESFQFILPARIHAFVDYKLKDRKFLTFFLNQSILSNKRIAPFGMSTVGIVPRYETKNVMLTFPLVVSNNFQHVTFGVTGRYRSFYLGTNHLPGFFNFSKTKGMSVYGGIFIPFYERKPKIENDCYYPGDKKRKKITPFWKKRSY